MRVPILIKALPFHLRRFLATSFGFAVLLACCAGANQGCEAGESGGDDKTSAKPTPADAKPKEDSAKQAAGSQGLVIDGERFTRRVVKDAQQGDLAVFVFQAPEKWHDVSRVVWRYDYSSNPVSIWCSVENPDNAEAFYSFPPALCFWLRPTGNYYRPGQNYGGLIFASPVPPVQIMTAFVRQVRGEMPSFQIVGSKSMPELAKALKLKPSPNQQGIGLKVSYEVKGKPVEEEFYAVADSIDIPYDGPQGRTWQMNWGLTALHSFRAPQGTLERRRAVLAAMVKSVRINPAWEQRRAAVQNYLAEQFNRQLKAGYDSIAAAARLSRQLTANSDAMLASIDRQLQASRTAAATGESPARSSTDKFDDYVRGVETVDDPYWGTSQHSLNEQYHWTDGYGTYRNSNDASYDPNQHENGDWQLMQPTR